MREIKFRAWDKRFKEWSMAIGSDALKLQEDYPDRYIIVQFTGLHDKNGKEIYEGDIIKAIDKYAFKGEYDFIQQAQIVWWDKGFFAKTEVGNIYFYETNVEVIGNIYENPELLKEVA